MLMLSANAHLLSAYCMPGLSGALGTHWRLRQILPEYTCNCNQESFKDSEGMRELALAQNRRRGEARMPGKGPGPHALNKPILFLSQSLVDPIREMERIRPSENLALQVMGAHAHLLRHWLLY